MSKPWAVLKESTHQSRLRALINAAREWRQARIEDPHSYINTHGRYEDAQTLALTNAIDDFEKGDK